MFSPSWQDAVISESGVMPLFWLKEAACLCMTCSRSEPGAIAFCLALSMASCRAKPSVCHPCLCTAKVCDSGHACKAAQSGEFPAAKELLLETIYVWGNDISVFAKEK